LYLDDIVKVLATTKRSIEGLIQRKSFPFETKKIGGRICVDIVQVARYLASEQMGESSVPAPKPKARAQRTSKQVSDAAQPVKSNSSAPSQQYGPYAIRQKLDEWNKRQAYNCYQLLAQPLEEGIDEALRLMLLELLRVEEPAAAQDHIAIWRFQPEGVSMEPELNTFPLAGRFKNPADLKFLISRRLNDHRLVIAQTFCDGECVAEGLYMGGQRVTGSTPEELVAPFA